MPYNQFWLPSGSTIEDDRASLIEEPADGRLPPVVPGAGRQVGSFMKSFLPAERPIRYRGGGAYPNGPEDRGLAERCLIGFNTGPPILPGAYNQNLQIFQTADHVVIYNEMVHDARIIPLGGHPHVPDAIRQWMGDSQGYWDGDTLVIESTNFTEKTAGFNDSLTTGIGDGKALHLTERLRLRNADTLEYEFAVNDPATFTAAFTGMIPMAKSDSLIFEYACHEGNYALHDILAGARVEELAGGRRDEVGQLDPLLHAFRHRHTESAPPRGRSAHHGRYAQPATPFGIRPVSGWTRPVGISGRDVARRTDESASQSCSPPRRCPRSSDPRSCVVSSGYGVPACRARDTCIVRGRPL